MLITFVRELFKTTIGVSEDWAEEVSSALAMKGWHPVSKIYAPASSVVDSLQVALLDVSTLPSGTPIRVAVEFGASAAILSSPLWLNPQSAHNLVSSRQGVH